MEMISTLLEEVSANTLNVGSWLWVDVLHINNPHSFYVRPRTYSKYLSLLQARGKVADASEINVGEVYVFKSKLLKSNIRGKIISYEKTNDDVKFRLFAIDIGCIEDNISHKRMWKMLCPLLVPSLVIHCQLADCAPRGETWDIDATDAMRNYVQGECAKIMIRGKTSETLTVELYNSCPDDIATLLALTSYTTFGYGNNEVNRFQIPHVISRLYYSRREIQNGTNLHVRMQSGTLLGKFYVTPLEEYQSYLKDRDNYTTQARFQQEVSMDDLKLNAPIGVYYHKNNKFERAIVKELLPGFNRAKVQLVDWGIEIEESVIKMRELPEWYQRVPTRALYCTLHSRQSLSNDFSSLALPGAEFRIAIKTVGNEDAMHPYVVLVSPMKVKR